MKRFFLPLLLLPGLALAQPVPWIRATDSFNIMESYNGVPGAKCNGVADDDAAINSALAAAAASTAYQNNDAVTITGPAGSNTTGCVMHSANMTIFTKGSGGNPRPRVTLSGMTWLCTGAGNICLDALGAELIASRDFSIRGDNVAPPEICIQVGTPTGPSSAWHVLDRFNCNNQFTFTALYNVGSEANTYKDSFFANGTTTKSPIGTLGAITAGSAYTNGTYTGVPLTGGTGAGATANITVAGGVVTAVTPSYQGRGYTAGDTLSASAANIGGTGSGFSIPVATVKNYAVVIDGINHWHAASAFTNVTLPVDTWTSTTLITFLGSNIRQAGAGGAVWEAGSGGLHMVNSYVLNFGGTSCFDLYNANNQSWSLSLDANCEGGPSNLTSAFFITGPNTTPNLRNFRWHGYHQSPGTVFATDTNIASVTMPNADIAVDYISNVVPMFDRASLFTVSGKVSVPTANMWNEPNFQGQLLLGTMATPPNVGPLDIFGSAAIAVSCARLLLRTYTGPLCRFVRASDSTSLDIYPDGLGNLDRGAYQAFCTNTTCAPSVGYDESGNGNNLTQATAANQPQMALQVSALKNRPAALWATASDLAANAAASINDVFASGGFVSAVVNQNSNALANRLFAKLSGSGGANPGLGIDVRVNPSGANPFTITVGATTSNGAWVSTAPLSLAAHIYDMQYSTAANSNNPTLAVDGSTVTLTPTAPVGTISTDAAQKLVLGNNTDPGTNRGFIGSIAEFIEWKTTPSVPQLEAIRRNQAAYYGVAGVN